jgi:uncharacterized protein YggT (Ycf19 family)|uniref:Uncharacterized protein ycf19 n=1 Tax=Vaucheria litorea TaxID=109269 RepID=B7T1T3_VAULI|nr:hypothetical protein RF19 [Vaucheria litorea]ACF70899.1 hypothetical protein RF19 [Vaucheria litorea]
MDNTLFTESGLIYKIFGLINFLAVRFLNEYSVLKSDYPMFIDLLNYILHNLVLLLRLFNVFFTLRFMLAWFPNINPFIAPYYVVRVATQPYIDYVAKRIPYIFGQDVSFLVCSILLNYALDVLPKIHF